MTHAVVCFFALVAGALLCTNPPLGAVAVLFVVTVTLMVTIGLDPKNWFDRSDPALNDLQEGEYDVEWTIPLFADDPLEAAATALSIQRALDSISHVFVVSNKTGDRWEVDLDAPPHGQVKPLA